MNVPWLWRTSLSSHSWRISKSFREQFPFQGALIHWVSVVPISLAFLGCFWPNVARQFVQMMCNMKKWISRDSPSVCVQGEKRAGCFHLLFLASIQFYCKTITLCPLLHEREHLLYWSCLLLWKLYFEDLLLIWSMFPSELHFLQPHAT